MSEFDIFFDKYENKHNCSPERYECFEAGQQSKQSEIDELQNKYDAMYKAFTVADDCRKEWHSYYISIHQREDDLQKRIDEISNHVEINYDENRDDDSRSYWSGYNQALRELIKILKGEETK